jgi:hypothetical protein
LNLIRSSGQPIFPDQPVVEQQYSAEDELLNDTELEHYLRGTGDWTVSESVLLSSSEDTITVNSSSQDNLQVSSANNNQFLKKIVDELTSLISPPKPPVSIVQIDCEEIGIILEIQWSLIQPLIITLQRRAIDLQLTSLA